MKDPSENGSETPASNLAVRDVGGQVVVIRVTLSDLKLVAEQEASLAKSWMDRREWPMKILASAAGGFVTMSITAGQLHAAAARTGRSVFSPEDPDVVLTVFVLGLWVASAAGICAGMFLLYRSRGLTRPGQAPTPRLAEIMAQAQAPAIDSAARLVRTTSSESRTNLQPSSRVENLPSATAATNLWRRRSSRIVVAMAFVAIWLFVVFGTDWASPTSSPIVYFLAQIAFPFVLLIGMQPLMPVLDWLLGWTLDSPPRKKA